MFVPQAHVCPRGYPTDQLFCCRLAAPPIVRRPQSDDVKERYAGATKYYGKSVEWWRNRMRIHVDNHYFEVARTNKDEELLAKRRVRGVYRQRGRTAPRAARFVLYASVGMERLYAAYAVVCRVCEVDVRSGRFRSGGGDVDVPCSERRSRAHSLLVHMILT